MIFIPPSATDRTSAACEAALSRAGIASPGGLDAVLVLGGTARIDAVGNFASKALGGAPAIRTARPEEATALGAATVAHRLQELEFQYNG